MSNFTFLDAEKDQDVILTADQDFKFDLYDLTVPEYLLSKIEELKNAGIQTGITNTITGEFVQYTDLAQLSRNVANAFHIRGMKRGDTVLYSAHDPTKLHAMFLGIWQANGNVRASYPEDTGEPLVTRLKESKVRWVVCDQQWVSEHKKAISAVPWSIELIVFGHDVPGGCTPAKDLFKYEESQDENSHRPWKMEITPEDIAVILPTSGTTGPVKGAVYTHATFLRNIVMLSQLPFTDDISQPFLTMSKMTHFTGAVYPLAFIACGRSLLMNPQANKDTVLDAISTYKPRGLFTFPKFLECLMNYPKVNSVNLDCLQHVTTAGQIAGTSFTAALNKLPNITSLMVVYGMTEIGILTVTANWTGERFKKLTHWQGIPASTTGKLVPGTKLKIRDLETNDIVGPGKKGELLIQSPFAFNGYFNEKTQTTNFMLNGWATTGDVGHYDQTGLVYLTDRKKELFKYCNNHISPSELENILAQHPAVGEVCVVGVEDPDGIDYIPRAFVVLRSDFGNVTVDDIQEFYQEQVSPYKYLRGGLYILPQMPVGRTGKVTRKIMSELIVPIASSV